MSQGPNDPPPGDQPPQGGPQPGDPAGQPPPPQQEQQQQPPPPAPQAPQPAAGVDQPADLMTRFLAKLIDWILLSIVNFAIIVPVIIGAIFSASVSGAGFGFGTGPFLMGLALSLLAVAYFALLESNRGQTVGKMLMKVQVRGPDGQNPPLEMAVKRNAWMLLGIVPVLGGLAQLAVAILIAVTINNNVQTRQGWHDEFSGGTSVIKIG